METTPFDIEDYLKKKALASAQAAPVPPSPVDQYTAALKTAPNISDYHPSKLREILGTMAGVGVGLAGHDMGISPTQARTGVIYGPFQHDQLAYQQKLAPLKEASNVYQEQQKLRGVQSLQESEIAEREAQTKAEVERAAAEKARADLANRTYRPSNEQERLGEIEAKKSLVIGQPYNFEDSGGEKGVGIWTGDGFKVGDKIVSLGAVESFSSTGPVKEPAAPGLGVQALNAVQSGDTKKVEDLKRVESIMHPTQPLNQAKEEEEIKSKKEASERGRVAEADRVAKVYYDRHAKELDKIGEQVKAFSSVDTLIKTGGMEGGRLAAPAELKSILTTGGVSGIRITQAEINQISGATGIKGKLENFLSGLEGQQTLTDQQRNQLFAINNEIKRHIMIRADTISQGQREIQDAQINGDREGIIRAEQKLNDRIQAINNSTYKTGTDKNGNKVYSLDWDGKKGTWQNESNLPPPPPPPPPMGAVNPMSSPQGPQGSQLSEVTDGKTTLVSRDGGQTWFDKTTGKPYKQ